MTPTNFVSVTRWTRTQTNKLLLDAGFALYDQEYTELYQSAVTGQTDALRSQIDTKSAQGEAALELAMNDSGALKDARILNTARNKMGDSLLADFKAGKP